MTIDTKSSLILLATLILGIALGALGVGALAHRRGDHLRELRHRGGFVEYMERVIQPRNEAQREAIRPILEETGRIHWTLMGSTHTRMVAELERMRQRLAPHLDEAQRERLESSFGEFGHPLRGRRSNDRPRGGPDAND
ncbi:MAG: hypothetical protein ACREMK_00890 [Gemmatimonadota bacterium]